VLPKGNEMYSIPLGNTYTLYCVFCIAFTHEQRKDFITRKPPKKVQTTVKKIKPPMSDHAVINALDRHNESGFDDLPNWLKKELRTRNINMPPRRPTDIEKWETVSDAREHRITNKELTIRDYQDKYMKQKSFGII